MKGKFNKHLCHWLAGLAMCAAMAAQAVTLEQLRSDRQLTPQRFAAYFAGFAFKFHEAVQDPVNFLATESGDCDDYATLAAEVLAEKGYTTRLITVRMAGENHVVCYVEETRCYLDYNNRSVIFRTVASNGTLPDIATKVARSFDAPWTSAAVFTFDGCVKRLGQTATPDGSPANHPPLLASAGRARIKIDF
jgi:hypothetical protein